MKEVGEQAPRDLRWRGEASLLAELTHRPLFPGLLSGVRQAVKILHPYPNHPHSFMQPCMRNLVAGVHDVSEMLFQPWLEAKRAQYTERKARLDGRGGSESVPI